MTVLTQEEMDAVIYDAREGDLATLQEIFTEISPEILPTIKDENTLSTPVHMAAANGHLEVVKYLLSIVPRDQAIKLANQKNEIGNTPLHWAAFNGHLEVVKLLCEEYEGDVYSKNESHHDVIFEAENNNQSEVETYLLKKYAVEDDVKLEDDGEDTKITYTPGKESREAEEHANKVTQEREEGTEGVKEATAQTKKLSI